jgi:hypothetical protein
MLGVIETSLAGESDEGTPVGARRALHRARHLFPKRPRSGGDPKVRRWWKKPKHHDLHHTVNRARVFLGGLRRSFAASL